MADDDSEALSKQADADMGRDKRPVKLWLEEIKDAKKANEEYWRKCDQIAAKYKGEENADVANLSKAPRKYNVLWSIIQTMQPLVYSKRPKPFVARRFNDSDPVARDASQIIQRALKFGLEGNELHDALMDARDDYLIASRGVIWPKYSPYMQLRDKLEKVTVEDPSMTPPEYEAVQAADGTWYYEEAGQYEEKVYEECDWEHVHYRDFLHGPAAKWKHVPWVARRVPMTRKQLIDRFGDEVGKKVPLTINNKSKGSAMGGDEGGDENKGIFAKAEVWEIWDKSERMVYWLCPQYPKDFLDEQDDFLELERFFPCPKPAYGTKTNDSLMPTPDYCLWQDIAIELDEVTHRIKLLTEALRVVGVYDQSLGETLKRITTQTTENDLIPVQNWAMFAEKGGLSNSIEWLPIDQVASVLGQLHQARQQLVQELYEITGISDIVRGASNPRETAQAQKVKGEYANKRLSEREKEMVRMVDEALEIQAEITSKHYSDDTIKMVASAEQVLTDPATKQFDQNRFTLAMQLIRSQMRQYRVCVDEKTLIEEDAAEESQQRGEIVATVNGLLGTASQMMQGPQGPMVAPFISQMIMFALRSFPLAQSEESALQSTLDQVVAKVQEPPPPAQPDPIETKKLELEGQRLQIEQQRLQLEMQKLQIEQQKIQMELQIKQLEVQLQNENRQKESQLREQKQTAEAMLRYEQMQSQERAQQASSQAAMEKQRETNAVTMNKWLGDADLREKEMTQRERVELLRMFADTKLRQEDLERRDDVALKERKQDKLKLMIDAFKGIGDDGDESRV